MFGKRFVDKFSSKSNDFSSKRYTMLVGIKLLIAMILYQALISGYLLVKLDKVDSALNALEHTPHVFPDWAWMAVSGMISILGGANAYAEAMSNKKDENINEEVA